MPKQRGGLKLAPSHPKYNVIKGGRRQRGGRQITADGLDAVYYVNNFTPQQRQEYLDHFAQDKPGPAPHYTLVDRRPPQVKPDPVTGRGRRKRRINDDGTLEREADEIGHPRRAKSKRAR